MKTELIENVVDEESFVSLLFSNDLTKQRLYWSLKEFIFRQNVYSGIKGYCMKTKLPPLQFISFIDVCIQKKIITRENNQFRFTDAFLEKLKNISPEWANYYNKIHVFV